MKPRATAKTRSASKTTAKTTASKRVRPRELDDAGLTLLAEKGLTEAPTARDPSEPPSNSGHRVREHPGSDDTQTTARLVQRGVNQAARDQRQAAR